MKNLNKLGIDKVSRFVFAKDPMPSWKKRVGTIEDAKNPERQQYYKDLYEYHKKTTGELSKFEVAKQGEQILKDLNMHKIPVGDIGGISKTMFKAYRENVKNFPKTSFVLKRLQVGWKNIDFFHEKDEIEIKDGWFHVYRGGKEMKISLVNGTVEGDLKVAKKKPKAVTDAEKKAAEAKRKAKEAARKKAEAEAAAKKAAEEAAKAEAEAQKKAEEEAAAKKAAEKEAARKKAEEEAAKLEAKKKAEEETAQLAKEEKAEAEAKRKAEEEAKKKAEKETVRLEAEKLAELEKLEAEKEEAARQEAIRIEKEEALKEAKMRTEKEAKAAEEARLKAEEKAAKAKEKEAQYAGFIASGDEKFGVRDYENAKKDYESAAEAKPDEEYPKSKIAEIEKILAEKLEKIERNPEQKILDEIAVKAGGGSVDWNSTSKTLFKVDKKQKAAISIGKGVSMIKINMEGSTLTPQEAIVILNEPAASKNLEKRKEQGEYFENMKELNSFAGINVAVEEAEKEETKLNYDIYGDILFGLTGCKVIKELLPDPIQKTIGVRVEKGGHTFSILAKNYGRFDPYEPEPFICIFEGKETQKTGLFKKETVITEEFQKEGNIEDMKLYIKEKSKKTVEIKKGKTAKEKKEEYDHLITSGNQKFETKNYETAKKAYEAALEVKPDEQYPKDKIAEIEKILSEKKEEVEVGDALL